MKGSNDDCLVDVFSVDCEVNGDTGVDSRSEQLRGQVPVSAGAAILQLAIHFSGWLSYCHKPKVPSS